MTTRETKTSGGQSLRIGDVEIDPSGATLGQALVSDGAGKFTPGTVSGGGLTNPLAADLNFNSHKGTGLADATADTDALSLKLLRQVGLKAPVAVAATSNITLSGEQTLDGVLTSASRVLVMGQTLSQQNGIYVSAAGAWTRAADADTVAKLPADTLVPVAPGGTNTGGKVYKMGAQPVTLGTTAIAFTEFGAAATGAPAGTILKPVRVALTTALSGLGAFNYVAGVYTATSNGALGQVDGTSLSVNDDIALAGEADLTKQGIVTVTSLGSGGAPWVLTRRSDVPHGGAIPWGAEVRVTDGTAANRGVLYVDGVVGTTGTIGTNSFKFATPDVRTPFIAPVDGNAKALTNLGDVTTTAPTATGGSPTKNSQTLTLSGAFLNGSSASVANNATLQHKLLTSGGSTAEAATDLVIGGVNTVRFTQNAAQAQNAVVVGKRTLAAAGLGSSEGVGNYFETYGGPFYFLYAGAVGDVGYSGSVGHTTTIQMTIQTSGCVRIGTTSADPGLGAGGLRVDGYSEFASTVTLLNAVNLAWKDSGGTQRTLLTFDASNVLQFGNASYKTKHLGGEINAPTRPGAYPYTLLATDRLIFADGTSAGRTLNLPSAPPDGTTYTICLRGTNAVALARGGSDTISWYGGAGQTSVNLTYSVNVTWTAVYDATQAIWYVGY